MSVRRLHTEQPSGAFAFNSENLSWARTTISKYPPGKQASAVIPLLWRAQEQNDNWVSKPVIEYVADMLGMSYIRVLEVATFYTMFQLQPVGSVAHIQVCGTTPCMLRGAEDLKKVCQSRIHHEPHHLSADGRFSWEEVECLGACVNAPMVQIFKDTYEDLTPASLEKLIDDLDAGRKVKVGPQINRHHAAAEGGPTTLIDAGLYKGTRSFTRVEPPPPPPPADAPIAAVAAGTPSPAAAPPKPADIRPVSEAAKAADAQKEAAEKKQLAAGAAMDPKAVKETNVTRATPQEVKEKAQVRSLADVKPKPITNPKAPAPIKLADQKIQPARKPAVKDDGKPELLKKPKGGKGDDLKLIWGVGPALEKLLNTMGIWHFDQIASWSAKDLAWVDDNLEGFKGRAKRDDWVRQAKKLAKGWRPDNDVGERPGKR